MNDLTNNNITENEISAMQAAEATADSKIEQAEDMAEVGIKSSASTTYELGETEDYIPEETDLDDGENIEYNEAEATQFSAAEEKKLKEELAAEIEEEERSNARSIDANGAAVIKAADRAFRAREHVISIGRELECDDITTQMEKIRADFRYAAQSYQVGHGYVRGGYVSAIDESTRIKVKDENGNIVERKTVWLIVNDGPIAVYIPIENFTRLAPQEGMSPSDYSNLLKRYANNRVGSYVEYMVVSFNELERTAMATRIPVLDRNAKKYYLTKYNRRYRINEGDIVEARITFISARSMGVEAFGVESIIPVNEVSGARVFNLYDYYAEKGQKASDMIGKTIQVRVVKIDRDKDRVNRLELSVRRVFDERSMYIGHIRKGMRMNGRIVDINRYGIFAKIDNLPLDTICNVYDSCVYPRIGSRVQMVIRGVEVKKGEDGDVKYEISALILRVLG